MKQDKQNLFENQSPLNILMCWF